MLQIPSDDLIRYLKFPSASFTNVKFLDMVVWNTLRDKIRNVDIWKKVKSRR